jgi:hypothetical protein
VCQRVEEDLAEAGVGGQGIPSPGFGLSSDDVRRAIASVVEHPEAATHDCV